MMDVGGVYTKGLGSGSVILLGLVVVSIANIMTYLTDNNLKGIGFISPTVQA